MARPPLKEQPEYGRHLAKLREAAGLTQKELADRLEVRQSNISFWERWDRPPRGEVVPLLAEALGVSTDVLLKAKPMRAQKAQPPGGMVRRVFDQVGKLPKRQQQKIVGVVEALLAQQKGAKGAG